MPEPQTVITHTLASLGVSSDYYNHRDIATAIEDDLGRAGYTIERSTSSLLEKGKEVGKLHD